MTSRQNRPGHVVAEDQVDLMTLQLAKWLPWFGRCDPFALAVKATTDDRAGLSIATAIYRQENLTSPLVGAESVRR